MRTELTLKNQLSILSDDLYSHSTDESFTQLMLDTKKYTFMDMQSDTAHIKQLGGFDGCTMPESECSQQVDSARLEPNGYISLVSLNSVLKGPLL